MQESRGIPTVLVLVAATVVAVLVLWHAVHRGTTGPVYYAARPSLTPGALNPDVTQAAIRRTICVRGWTATVRPPTEYTNGLKVEQMPLYGESGSTSDYQEDHLISLELGGNPTDPKNLWPEPYPRAADVDKIENQLNDKVCSGQLALSEAQQQESALKHDHG